MELTNPITFYLDTFLCEIIFLLFRPFVTCSQQHPNYIVFSYYVSFYQLPLKVRVMLLLFLCVIATHRDQYVEVKFNQCLLNKQIEQCVLKQIISWHLTDGEIKTP